MSVALFYIIKNIYNIIYTHSTDKLNDFTTVHMTCGPQYQQK